MSLSSFTRRTACTSMMMATLLCACGASDDLASADGTSPSPSGGAAIQSTTTAPSSFFGQGGATTGQGGATAFGRGGAEVLQGAGRAARAEGGAMPGRGNNFAGAMSMGGRVGPTPPGGAPNLGRDNQAGAPQNNRGRGGASSAGAPNGVAGNGIAYCTNGVFDGTRCDVGSADCQWNPEYGNGTCTCSNGNWICVASQ